MTQTFQGELYSETMDKDRLIHQRDAVLWALQELDTWATVKEIQSKIVFATGILHPETSLSANIRNLRKEEHGHHYIPGRYREGTRIAEYRLLSHPGKIDI